MSDLKYAGIIPGDIDYTWQNIAYGYCGEPVQSGTYDNEPSQAPPDTELCTNQFMNSTYLNNYFN